MRKLAFLLGLLLILFSSCLAMAPGSSNSAGIEKNIFQAGDPVYIKHIGTLVCGKQVMSGDMVTVDIVGDRNWTDGDPITSPIYSLNITLGLSGKLPSNVIWNNSVAGLYDIILDINQDGIFDASGDCMDVIDGAEYTGFTVMGSNNTTIAAPVANTSIINTSYLTANNSVTTVTQTSSSTFDVIPLVIILLGILIAVIIVVVTWMTLR